jgi:4-amino-4-deoxy-L-arabinose transferase-like glycosyltransferase
LVLLAGAAIRIAPLTENRFHPDEGLYASYGLLIANGDWNLASRLVDKPPLVFYLMSGSFLGIGPNEVAARLPNLFASLLGLALVWRLAMRLWGSRDGALLAMLFCALSPMAVLFGPTAFTDPLLVLWILAALVSVTGGRWGWGGLFAGLALATKQTALFFFPLMIVLGLLSSTDHPLSLWERGTEGEGMPRQADKARRSDEVLRLLRFALPIVVVIGLLVAWDSSRGPVTGFWRAGVANNDPGRLAHANEVWPRLGAWLDWLQYFGGWLPANAVIVGALLTVVGYDVRRRQRTRQILLDLCLAGFVLAYLMVYWLVAFNIYDRYLLPLIPLVGLLVARALVIVLPNRGTLAAILLVGLMAWPAVEAARSHYPTGGDHGAYDGIDELAAYLDGLPTDTVIYDHWLGWPLDFYLSASPAYTSYFSTPADLTAMLRTQSEEQPAVLLWPAWVDPGEVLAAASEAGYGAVPAYETVNRFGDTNLLVFDLNPAFND